MNDAELSMIDISNINIQSTSGLSVLLNLELLEDLTFLSEIEQFKHKKFHIIGSRGQGRTNLFMSNYHLPLDIEPKTSNEIVDIIEQKEYELYQQLSGLNSEEELSKEGSKKFLEILEIPNQEAFDLIKKIKQKYLNLDLEEI